MSVLFKAAKKRWLANQDSEFLDNYNARQNELKSEGMSFYEREDVLDEEFGIDKFLLAVDMKIVQDEWDRKKKAKAAKSTEPPSPPEDTEDGPVSKGGFVASNDVVNIKWVAEALPDDSATKDDAPNSAAWGLLCWARRNPDPFYTQIYKQVVIPTRREIEESTDAANDEERLIEALNRVRKIAGELIES